MAAVGVPNPLHVVDVPEARGSPARGRRNPGKMRRDSGSKSDGFQPLQVEEGRAQPRPVATRCKTWMVVTSVVMVVGVLAALVVLIVQSTGESGGGDGPQQPQRPVTLENALNVSAMMDTLRDLEAIAYQNSGSRSVAYGFNASINYLKGRVASLGSSLVMSEQLFSMKHSYPQADPVLQNTAPYNMTFVFGQDFRPLVNQGGGNARGRLESIPAYGCRTMDYSAFVSGRLALVSRGNCTFQLKVIKAQAAGATGLLIYNDGATPSRMGLIPGSIGEPPSTIPVFGLNNGEGLMLVELARYANISMSMTSAVRMETLVTSNLIVDTDTGSADNLIVIGAHADSVDAGPGINDNGSGVAFVLELMEQYAKMFLATPEGRARVKNRLQFAFWGSEEYGLLGSKEYVLRRVQQATTGKIAGYLNFDMLASPNHVTGILDTSHPAMPVGAAKLSALVKQALANISAPAVDHIYDGRSDYGPFIAAGIPATSLELGAEKLKTPAERTMFGGMANAWLDPCYHQSCDTVENINQDAYSQVSHAAAAVVELLVTAGDVRALLASP